MSGEVNSHSAALPVDQRGAPTALRACLDFVLPDHIEIKSCVMPGSRQPGPKGKTVAGCAGFARHLGLYPRSRSVIPKTDRTPFKASKSGVLFAPDRPLPDTPLRAIIDTRQEEAPAGYRRKA